MANKYCLSLCTGAALILAACSPEPESAPTTEAATDADPAGPPLVVASFSVLANLASMVAGPDIEVVSLCPVGAEVHEWELTPRNFTKLEEAGLVLVNGYDLEQWLPQIEATVPENVPVVAVAEETEYPTLPIRLGDFEGDPDPHLWMDPRAAVAYLEVIADRLSEIDPENASLYANHAAMAADRIYQLYAELQDRLAVIPHEQRILITSEAAFLYFADAFDFQHDGIWGSNAEEEGSPAQLARIIDIINQEHPAALFWESTISDRYVRSVAEETGTPVAGPLYVDSLGDEASGVTSYMEMLQSNVSLILETLAPESP